MTTVTFRDVGGKEVAVQKQQGTTLESFLDAFSKVSGVERHKIVDAMWHPTPTAQEEKQKGDSYLLDVLVEMLVEGGGPLIGGDGAKVDAVLRQPVVRNMTVLYVVGTPIEETLESPAPPEDANEDVMQQLVTEKKALLVALPDNMSASFRIHEITEAMKAIKKKMVVQRRKGHSHGPLAGRFVLGVMGTHVGRDMEFQWLHRQPLMMMAASSCGNKERLANMKTAHTVRVVRDGDRLVTLLSPALEVRLAVDTGKMTLRELQPDSALESWPHLVICSCVASGKITRVLRVSRSFGGAGDLPNAAELLTLATIDAQLVVHAVDTLSSTFNANRCRTAAFSRRGDSFAQEHGRWHGIDTIKQHELAFKYRAEELEVGETLHASDTGPVLVDCVCPTLVTFDSARTWGPGWHAICCNECDHDSRKALYDDWRPTTTRKFIPSPDGWQGHKPGYVFQQGLPRSAWQDTTVDGANDDMKKEQRAHLGYYQDYHPGNNSEEVVSADGLPREQKKQRTMM